MIVIPRVMTLAQES